MTEVFMAFDYGERRTGVALGQSITRSARPISTIINTGKEPNWPEINKVIQEWRPNKLIVGMPDNREENKRLRRKITAFYKELTLQQQLPVILHDESLSSDEAYYHLKNKRSLFKGKIDKTKIDQYAAAILLQSWMNTYLLET
jgi:putative Holliday junction resolvase